jgi:hypothetical protein
MLNKAPEECAPQRVQLSGRRHDRDLDRSKRVVLHEELRNFRRKREHRLKNRVRAAKEGTPDSDDILILDSGASVPIVSEQTWEILIDHKVKLPISGKPLLMLHATWCYLNPHQGQTLLNQDDFEMRNIVVKDRARCYGGDQRLEFPNGTIVPLKYAAKSREKYLSLRKPTAEDVKDLPCFRVCAQGSHKLSEEPQRIFVDRRVQSTDTKGYSHEWDDGLLKDWSYRLNWSPHGKIKQTFSNTTQMAPTVEHEERNLPRNHRKTRFPWARPRRLNKPAYCDLLTDNRSNHNHKYIGVLFEFVRSKRLAFYSITTKDQAKDCLNQLFIDYGCPSAIYSDCDNVLSAGSGFRKAASVVKLSVHPASEVVKDSTYIKCVPTSPHHQERNRVERYIDHVKQRASVLQTLYGIPPEFMKRLYKHICTCNDYIASESLNWKTPLEVATGETPDISHIRFHFYQPVWYLSPTATAGETRYLKGNFIGFSDTVGDNFSYEIAVKKTRSTQAKTLSRTVVLPRDLQDSAFPGQSNPSTLFPRPVVPSAGRNRTTASECDTGGGTKIALERPARVNRAREKRETRKLRERRVSIRPLYDRIWRIQRT